MRAEPNAQLSVITNHPTPWSTILLGNVIYETQIEPKSSLPISVSPILILSPHLLPDSSSDVFHSVFMAKIWSPVTYLCIPCVLHAQPISVLAAECHKKLSGTAEA